MSVFSRGERRLLLTFCLVFTLLMTGRLLAYTRAINFYSHDRVKARTVQAASSPDSQFVATSETELDSSTNSEPTFVEDTTPDLININTANQDTLTLLPGIGPVIASRIIEYRETHGPFMHIEQLLAVSGIGSARFDAIKTLVTVGDIDP